MGRDTILTQNYMYAMVRNPYNGKYLAIEETKGRGWWVPGGGLHLGESFQDAVHREIKEEAGLEGINIRGILRVMHVFNDDKAKVSIAFYCEPKDEESCYKGLKTKADKESQQAKWLSLDEFKEMNRKGELRFDDPV